MGTNGIFGVTIIKKSNGWAWSLRHELEPEYPDNQELNQWFVFAKGKSKTKESALKEAMKHLSDVTVVLKRKETSNFIEYAIY